MWPSKSSPDGDTIRGHLEKTDEKVQAYSTTGKLTTAPPPPEINYASFGSALHARASSIRHVKIPGVRQSINKKGTANTPGSMHSMHSMSSTGGDKEGEFVGGIGTAEAAVALPEGGGSLNKSKNVAWEDAEKEEEAPEKVSQMPGELTRLPFFQSQVQTSKQVMCLVGVCLGDEWYGKARVAARCLCVGSSVLPV